MNKRWAWLIIAAMLLAALPVLAGPPGGVPPGLVNELSDGTTIAGPPGLVRMALPFFDLNEASWAIPHVVNMRMRNLVQGYPDGSFRPNAAVSQAEAIAMVVRALEMEQEAYALLEEEGMPAIPGIQARSWAAGYLLLAEKEGWIDLQGFQPNKAASRLWATVLLVKALEEPVSTDALVFSDADEIPPADRGYVAAAVQAGLLTGYEDVTFRPNRAVSRAEMAALIDRMLDLDPTTVVEGIITALETDSIEVDSQVYDLAAEFAVTLNGEVAPYSDLMVGYRVRITLDSEGNVGLIVATTVDATYQGVITGLDADEKILTLEIEDEGYTFTLASDVVIKLDGYSADYGDLALGFLALIEVNQVGDLTRITATSAGVDYTGVVEDKATDASWLLLLANDRLHLLHVSDAVVVVLNGEAADFADIRWGYEVQVWLDSEGEITDIAIVDTEVVVAGTITDLSLDGWIEITVNGMVHIFDWDEETDVTLDIVETATIEDLKQDDWAVVTAIANYAVSIDAEAKVTTYEGVLKEIDATQGTIVLWVDDGGIPMDIADEVTITYDNEDWDLEELGDLNLGSEVKVQLVRDLVTEIEVLDHLQSIEGIITAIDGQTITINDFLTFMVTEDTAITLDEAEDMELNDLAVGDTARITMSASLALFIDAFALTEQVMGLVIMVDEENLLTLWTATGEEVIAVCADLQEELDALAPGEVVRLTVRREKAIEMEVLALDQREGTISEILVAEDQVTLKINLGGGLTYEGTLVENAIVHDGTDVLAWDDLEEGDTVKVQSDTTHIYVVCVVETDS